MKRVLVIGGTGGVGRAVVNELSAMDVRIRALVRKLETAGLPAHVEAVRGDLTDAATLDRCVEGVDAVFLLWTAPATAVVPALERIASAAPRIVFLSSPHQTAHPFFQASQPNPMVALHRQIEEVIERSGCEWTFLRPGIFAANSLNWWAPQIRAGSDVVRWPYAAAPTAPIHERDIAAAAGHSLCEEGHDGRDYVLTGPESLTQAEQLTAIGAAIGRPLRMEDISPAEAMAELAAVIPVPAVKMLLASWAGAMGQPALVTSTVAEVTGKPARTFGEWAREHAAAFRP